MKANRFLRRFTARDGREVTLRTPRWGDLDDMLDFINSLIEEEAPIAINRKVTREEEVDWLAALLTDLEKGNHATIVAQVEGRMVGNVVVRPRVGRLKHMGTLGISIKKGYRGIGIGRELMTEIEPHARDLGVEVISLDVFENNQKALNLYTRMGYKEVGRIPKGAIYKGEYIDSITMIKEIKKITNSNQKPQSTTYSLKQ
jgi:RimJ/RimL family protein N-acetyltransferase